MPLFDGAGSHSSLRLYLGLFLQNSLRYLALGDLVRSVKARDKSRAAMAVRYHSVQVFQAIFLPRQTGRPFAGACQRAVVLRHLLAKE